MATKDNNTKLYKGSGISIAEVHTVVGDNAMDLGSLCSSSQLNKWAKFKPFRNSALWFSDSTAHEAALLSAHYGFNAINSADSSTGLNNTPKTLPTEYLKPRGVNSSYNEPYRIFDFVDLYVDTSQTPPVASTKGYNKNAVAPLEIGFPSYMDQAGTNVYIKCNGGVTGWSDDCVPLEGIMPESTFGSHKIALLLWKNTGVNNILVLDKTYSQFLVATNHRLDFNISGDADDPNTAYMPMMSESTTPSVYEGDTIRTIVCLVPPGTASGVATNINYDYFSLDLSAGLSYRNLIYHEKNSIAGMEGQMVVDGESFTTSDPSIKGYKLKSITLWLKPGPYWGDDIQGRTTVDVRLFMEVSSAYWGVNSSSSIPQDMDYDSSSKVAITNNFDSGGYTQDGLKSSDVSAQAPYKEVVTFTTNINYGAIHVMQKPFIFAVAGGTVKLKITGYAFMGANWSSPSFTVDFCDRANPNNNYIEITL